MNTRQLVDEMERGELGLEPRYGEEVERWPSEDELRSDENYE